jgi:hypothetical protein
MKTTNQNQNDSIFNRFFNPTQEHLDVMEAHRQENRRRAAAGLPSKDAERASAEIVASYTKNEGK